VVRELPELTLRWPIGHDLRLTAVPKNVTIITPLSVSQNRRSVSCVVACRSAPGKRGTVQSGLNLWRHPQYVHAKPNWQLV
jgi:hypothetical protein